MSDELTCEVCGGYRCAVRYSHTPMEIARGLEYKITSFITSRPGVDIDQIAGFVGVKQGPAGNPMRSPLNLALVALRDRGVIRTNSQWGAPRFFLARETCA